MFKCLNNSLLNSKYDSEVDKAMYHIHFKVLPHTDTYSHSTTIEKS